jgi:hypothetical protein
MGQAKNRGNQDLRIKQALEKAQALMPDFLTCNECGNHVTELKLLSTKGMSGIDVACAGTCNECGNHTFGVSGYPSATQRAMEMLSQQFGDHVTVGLDHFRDS